MKTGSMKPTPWGIDFAEPEGTVAERLRMLTAIQARLIGAVNAEGPDAKRFNAFYNPRFHAVGHTLATLRATLPDPGLDKDGMPLPRYDRAAVRKTPEYAADFAVVDLDKTFQGQVAAVEPPDPYEDFSSPNYTELDPNSDVTIGNGGATNSKISVDTLRRDIDARVFKDFGSAHFGGTFTHKFQCRCVANTWHGIGGMWALSNVVDDVAYWGTNLSQAVYTMFYGTATNDPQIYLRDTEDGETDTYAGASISTDYFCTADRSGTSLLLYIRTGSHEGALQDTLSITLTSGRTYRYCFGMVSGNAATYGSDTVTYYLQDLDLQEAGPSANGALRPWEYAFQFGVR